MILLSALLASLTGLMVGEGQVAPAQVELSAAPDAADPSPIIAAAVVTADESVVADVSQHAASEVAATDLIAVRSGRFHLNMKQSWLI